jgi:predicted ABC-class ATPase
MIRCFYHKAETVNFLKEFFSSYVISKILNKKKETKHKFWAASVLNLRPDNGICYAVFKDTLSSSPVINISVSKLQFIEKSKGKDKPHPRTGHEGPERE